MRGLLWASVPSLARALAFVGGRPRSQGLVLARAPLLRPSQAAVVRAASTVAKASLSSAMDVETASPPVTLLSGFLGAGKTTMLSGILANRAGLRVAVIVNDVASVNIDSDIIRREIKSEKEDGRSPIELLELQNGCVCCGPQAGELAASVLELVRLGVERGEPFDHVVIEMSGVADPGVVRMNLGAGGVDVARIVTVVDTPAFAEQWMSWDVIAERVLPADFSPYHDSPPKAPPLATADEIAADPCASQQKVVALLLSQIEVADVLALNKIDMATPKDLANAARCVRSLVPEAAVYETVRGAARLADLLPPSAKSKKAAVPAAPEERHDHSHAHAEDHHTTVGSGDCAEPECKDPTHDHSHGKKEADCSDPNCDDATHAHSHASSSSSECAEPACTDPTHAHSHASASEEACSDPDCDDRSHSHAHAAAAPFRDTTVDALGISSFVYATTERPFDYERLLDLVRDWPIPQKAGLDLLDLRPGGAGLPGVTSPWEAVLRSKGSVWLSTHPVNAVQWTFAGRHFALEDAGEWMDGGQGRTEIVIIGVDLDEAKLRADLDACLVTDAELKAFEKRQAEALEALKPRFDVGQAVECNFGPDGWKAGTVVALNYSEPEWADGRVAPYQVELDNGDLIFAPYDDDMVIRSRD